MELLHLCINARSSGEDASTRSLVTAGGIGYKQGISTRESVPLISLGSQILKENTMRTSLIMACVIGEEGIRQFNLDGTHREKTRLVTAFRRRTKRSIPRDALAYHPAKTAEVFPIFDGTSTPPAHLPFSTTRQTQRNTSQSTIDVDYRYRIERLRKNLTQGYHKSIT